MVSYLVCKKNSNVYMKNSMGGHGKTQKILAKCNIARARGPKQKRFCNWLGTRGIGGNTFLQYLQRFLCDISLLIILSN